MTPKLFSELGLSPEVLRAIDKLGFEQASPIQSEAIPLLLQGHDIVGQSQTGSGKTAAFGVPAVEKADAASHEVQVLVLCPTRELAVQVSEEIHKLALFKKGIRALPIYGGQSYERQFQGLKQGAQIIIGTPGRLMDHMQRGTLALGKAKMVILDEADVMLNMGFRDDIEKILQAVPSERQTVFFSATMPSAIRSLIDRYSRDPKSVQIAEKTVTVPTVEQVYYEVDRRYKIELLTRLIDIHNLRLGIIFCNTKRMVDDLVDHLNAQGYSADRLHGDMSQVLRDRVMNKFRKSGLEFLVATDVAARGIDVDNVEAVFNYDLPYDVEDYVHRVGRTGRRGRDGKAISFVAGRELFQIRNIERFTRTRIERGRVPSAGEVEEARSSLFLDRVRKVLGSPEHKRHEHFVERLLDEGFASTDISSALIHLFYGADQPTSRPPSPNAKPEIEKSPTTPLIAPKSDRPIGQTSAAQAPKAAPPTPSTSFRPVETKPLESIHKPAPPSRPKIVPLVHSKKEPRSNPIPVQAKPAHVPTEKAFPPKPPQHQFPTRREKKSLEPSKEKIGQPPKASRRTPSHQTRLWINLGSAHGLLPIDIVNAVAGETGLPGKVVGEVDIRERHLFADVDSEHVHAIVAKLNRARIKGLNVKAKLA